MDDQMLEGYAARKQTHMHKVAMVLSASRGDSLIITEFDLQLANTMLEDLEKDMHRVFSRIGRSEESMQAERFIEFVQRRGTVPYMEGYNYIRHHFPNFHDFEGILVSNYEGDEAAAAVERSGFMTCNSVGDAITSKIFTKLLRGSEDSMAAIEGIQKVIEQIGAENYLANQTE